MIIHIKFRRNLYAKIEVYFSLQIKMKTPNINNIAFVPWNDVLCSVYTIQTAVSTNDTPFESYRIYLTNFHWTFFLIVTMSIFGSRITNQVSFFVYFDFVHTNNWSSVFTFSASWNFFVVIIRSLYLS